MPDASNVIAFPKPKRIARAEELIAFLPTGYAEFGAVPGDNSFTDRYLTARIEREKEFLRQEAAKLGFRLHGNAKLEKRDQTNLVVLSQFRAQQPEAA